MPLPKRLVYNDLSGDEIQHILEERFAALLADIPYLKKHITLPRVRMTLHVTLDCWADQANPERRVIDDSVEVTNDSAPAAGAPAAGLTRPVAQASESRQAIVDASAKGDPPDKIREDHGLGVPTPTRGAVAIEDKIEGARFKMPNGAVIDRTGQSDKSAPNATVVEQDFGSRQKERMPLEFGNQHRGAAPAPDFSQFGPEGAHK